MNKECLIFSLIANPERDTYLKLLVITFPPDLRKANLKRKSELKNRILIETSNFSSCHLLLPS